MPNKCFTEAEWDAIYDAIQSVLAGADPWEKSDEQHSPTIRALLSVLDKLDKEP